MGSMSIKEYRAHTTQNAIKKKRAYSDEESREQQNLIIWSKNNYFLMPDGSERKVHDVLYAIPNGGSRHKLEAKRLKAEGTKSGVHDLNFPVPANGYAGLWIEMKRCKKEGEPTPSTSKSQLEWKDLMILLGHKAIICFGKEEAKFAIVEYLGDRFIGRFTGAAKAL